MKGGYRMDNQQQGKKSTWKFMDYDLPKWFKLPNPNVRGYFSRVKQGQPDVYTTPWVKGETNEEKLANFKSIVDEWYARLSSLEDKWPSLYAYEKDQYAKVGPMSVQKPLEERMDDICAYYEGVLLPAEPLSQEAISAVLDEFKGIRGIRLRSPQNTWRMMKKSTSSGTPFYKKKRLLSPNEIFMYDGVCEEGRGVIAIQYHKGGKVWPVSAMLGWRGQEGGSDVDDTKQRVVWMFPTAVNVEELRLYQPLIEACQAKELVPAWVSMELVDDRITRLFDTKGPDDLVVCTDFTKFDQHFNSVCQDAAKQILSALLSDGEEWLRNIFPIKYNIPLLCSDEMRTVGPHGMGSGSGGTNADETLLHRALQHEAALKHHQVLNPNSMCLGDDGILSYPGITAKDVTEVYSAHGLDMNPEKQEESAQFCTYLRRWHHVDYRVDGVCVGVYSTMRALGRLCMQERYYDPEDWGPKMVALRELSILENCKWHPLKEEFVKFCMNKDKFRLGLDIPGFLDNVAAEAKKAMDLMPDFLGYTKSLNKDASKGIDSWWIVNYLRSLK
nr:MAG: RNA-dependent RNA polymerase [Porcine picobirnavirus]